MRRRPLRPVRLGEIAERLGGRPVEGDPDFRVEGVAPLEEAGPGDLGFVRDEAAARALEGSAVGALVAPAGVEAGGRPTLRSERASLDFARAVGLLLPAERPEPGAHATAVVAEGAEVDPTASLGPHVVVGARARVGARSVLHAGARLGDDVRVGADCLLHAGAVVREGCELGDRVVLQPNAVIGGDGFGYELDESGAFEKIPQVGDVVLEDDVEVGANAAIDRARLGTTRIGRGVKIDNLVQIGHNCTIGAGSAVVAQAGLAGGSTVGRRAFLMAQSGVSNRAHVGDGAFLGGRAGAMRDVEPGERVWGFPIRPERAWHREMAALSRLPELLRRVKRLERALERRGGEGRGAREA